MPLKPSHNLLVRVSNPCGSTKAIEDLTLKISDRSKSPSVLTGGEKGFNHLGVYEVAVESIQLRQPKVVP